MISTNAKCKDGKFYGQYFFFRMKSKDFNFTMMFCALIKISLNLDEKCTDNAQNTQ